MPLLVGHLKNECKTVLLQKLILIINIIQHNLTTPANRKQLQKRCKMIQSILNNERIRTAALAGAILATCQVFAFLALSILSPYTAEIIQNTLISVGLFINIALAIMAGLLVVAVFAWNFGRGIHVQVETGGGLRLLGSGADWQEPDLIQDILIATRPGETITDFAARKEAALPLAGPARWVLVLQEGLPVGFLYNGPTSAVSFPRNAPPFQTETWTDEQRIVPANARFTDETETDFRQYVKRFCAHFREWSALKKMTEKPERAGVVHDLLLQVKPSASVFLLLLSMSAFGQKSAQVSAIPKAGEIPPKGAGITYTFEKAEVYRIGNGRANYAELLSVVPGYRDGGGGKLISIYAGTKSVYKAQQVEQVTEPSKASVMRPYSETRPGQGVEMPDSASMEEMADRAKYEIWKAGEVAKQVARPWWNTLMWTLWYVFAVIAIAAAVLGLGAKVFAKEGMYNWHKACRRGLAIILVSVGAILMVNGLLVFATYGVGPIGLSVVALVEVLLASWIVSFLVPNFTPDQGNSPIIRGNGQNWPGLNA